MGPSGTGKSTLLAIIGLLLAPSEGSVTLDGERVKATGSGRRHLRSTAFAWVFQSVSILPGRSVIDNVSVSLLAQGSTRRDAEQTSRAALDVVGLAAVADRKINSLSGGEVQRVCVARSLVREPRVLLADEPTGQLDAANSGRIVDAMLELRGRKTIVIVATHDRAVAERCDHLVQLDSLSGSAR